MSCFNGGQCSDPGLNNCTCPKGYTGSLCEARKFSYPGTLRGLDFMQDSVQDVIQIWKITQLSGKIAEAAAQMIMNYI